MPGCLPRVISASDLDLLATSTPGFAMWEAPLEENKHGNPSSLQTLLISTADIDLGGYKP